MTNEELKQALINEKPVEYNGIVYKYVNAIIWRKDNKGGRVVQAELMDMRTHSVTIADPSRVNDAPEVEGGQ